MTSDEAKRLRDLETVVLSLGRLAQSAIRLNPEFHEALRARVEPPEGLRDRDGWHWLETQVPADPPYIAQLPWFWAATNQTWRYGETMKRTPDELAQVGWRYASPCLTPAEVAALRARVAELEAALRNLMGVNKAAWLAATAALVRKENT